MYMNVTLATVTIILVSRLLVVDIICKAYRNRGVYFQNNDPLAVH